MKEWIIGVDGYGDGVNVVCRVFACKRSLSSVFRSREREKRVKRLKSEFDQTREQSERALLLLKNLIDSLWKTLCRCRRWNSSAELVKKTRFAFSLPIEVGSLLSLSLVFTCGLLQTIASEDTVAAHLVAPLLLVSNRFIPPQTTSDFRFNCLYL